MYVRASCDPLLALCFGYKENRKALTVLRDFLRDKPLCLDSLPLVATRHRYVSYPVPAHRALRCPCHCYTHSSIESLSPGARGTIIISSWRRVWQ